MGSKVYKRLFKNTKLKCERWGFFFFSTTANKAYYAKFINSKIDPNRNHCSKLRALRCVRIVQLNRERKTLNTCSEIIVSVHT